uniref:Uncharacterized protein n=1 Tax=Anguilla anguilla TaxID=7936 RepID=A0A0E9QMT7_ANGAN
MLQTGVMVTEYRTEFTSPSLCVKFQLRHLTLNCFTNYLAELQ